MDYPIWDLGMGGGVLIGIIAIAHVVVSHFAIGGGLLIAVTETLAVRRGDAPFRMLAKRSSLLLVLISTVFGAISGVGIWFAIGLVAPGATSALIHNYVWGWAIEWTFFVLEVATALAYYLTWDRVRPRTHLMLIWLYFVAAFLSLVVIQGILSFMLTPGRWLTTREFWDGFFNPSYFSGLVFRFGVCILLAGAYMSFAAQRETDAGARRRLIRFLSGWQVVGVVIAVPSFLWWQAVLPQPALALFDGPGALLPGLAATRTLLLLGAGVAVVISLLALAWPSGHRAPTAVLVLLAAFALLGGYERLREGARKPFVIREYMFSNGIRVDQIGQLNDQGALASTGWGAREGMGGLEETGRALFQTQCASCHTRNGYLSIKTLLAGADRDRVEGVVGLMRADADTWRAAAEAGERVEADALNYPLMPPFAGTEEEAEALTQYLLTLSAPGLASARTADGGER